MKYELVHAGYGTGKNIMRGQDPVRFSIPLRVSHDFWSASVLGVFSIIMFPFVFAVLLSLSSSGLCCCRMLN